MAIYYNSEKEIKNATTYADKISISINGCHVVCAKNTKTIREQVFDMMNVKGMECIAQTSYRNGDGKTTSFWFANPEFEEQVKDVVIGIYGNPEDKCRTYIL